MIWLILAACAGPRSATPASEVPAGRSVASAPPATTSRHVRARLAAGDQSWTDIIVDGTDSVALSFCDVLVETERLAQLGGNVELVRPCAVEALPPAPASAVQLVTLKQIPSLGRTATVLQIAPQPDRPACEAALVRLDADDQAQWLATQTARAQLLDDERQRLIERESQTCTPTESALPAEVEHRRHECDIARREREIVERKRAERTPPAGPQRSCREL